MVSYFSSALGPGWVRVPNSDLDLPWYRQVAKRCAKLSHADASPAPMPRAKVGAGELSSSDDDSVPDDEEQEVIGDVDTPAPSHVLAHCEDATVQKRRISTEEDPELRGECMLESEGRRWCEKCGIYQPLRTKHCRLCGRCCRTHDHHCPWLGVCVGEDNHGLFMCFTCLQLVHCLLIDWFAIEARNRRSTDRHPHFAEERKFNPFQPFPGQPLLFIGFLLSFAFTLMLTCLVPKHLVLALSSLTTWEIHRWYNMEHFRDFPVGPEEVGSPFTKATACGNLFVRLFGPRWCPKRLHTMTGLKYDDEGGIIWEVATPIPHGCFLRNALKTFQGRCCCLI
eukprot:gnl/TRDRNA2_/TRDRNA2_97778_c1_seq1.p1 gnl/TRDRNA2_/TRDRNA2_97778_c1~~gnl/TRDRNA2_/TRDRNA2_97778_c1_seq1.p1  ORF type:complete len:338 (+),score=25.53 gnl/TRDRNA2_/TRDRNA2_97778_c1_seq1:71-1084(+)